MGWFDVSASPRAGAGRAHTVRTERTRNVHHHSRLRGGAGHASARTVVEAGCRYVGKEPWSHMMVHGDAKVHRVSRNRSGCCSQPKKQPAGRMPTRAHRAGSKCQTNPRAAGFLEITPSKLLAVPGDRAVVFQPERRDQNPEQTQEAAGFVENLRARRGRRPSASSVILTAFSLRGARLLGIGCRPGSQCARPPGCRRPCR